MSSGGEISARDAREVFERAAAIDSRAYGALELPMLIEIGRDAGLADQAIVRAFLEQQAGVSLDDDRRATVVVWLDENSNDIDAHMDQALAGLDLRNAAFASTQVPESSTVAVLVSCDVTPVEAKARRDLFGSRYVGPVLGGLLAGASAIGIAQGFNPGDLIGVGIAGVIGLARPRDIRRHASTMHRERADLERKIRSAVRQLERDEADP